MFVMHISKSFKIGASRRCDGCDEYDGQIGQGERWHRS